MLWNMAPKKVRNFIGIFHPHRKHFVCEEYFSYNISYITAETHLNYVNMKLSKYKCFYLVKTRHTFHI